VANRLLADAVVVLHAAFVAFVVLGGFLAMRWPKVAWVHVPAAAYGFLVEAAGWVCPLTPLEIWLRRLAGEAGEAGYAGGFVERHLVPLVYPSPFPRSLAWTLAGLVVAANALAYALVLRHRRRAGRDRVP
jgi:hypothetical protein